jgi:hypothetical protein
MQNVVNDRDQVQILGLLLLCFSVEAGSSVEFKSSVSCASLLVSDWPVSLLDFFLFFRPRPNMSLRRFESLILCSNKALGSQTASLIQDIAKSLVPAGMSLALMALIAASISAWDLSITLGNSLPLIGVFHIKRVARLAEFLIIINRLFKIC